MASPVASTSKLPAHVLPVTSRLRPKHLRSRFVFIKAVPQTALPGDITRFLGTLNVPPDRIKGVTRSLTPDYRPADEVLVECATVQAAEDALASAASLAKGPQVLHLFGGPAARVTRGSENQLKHFRHRRALLAPDFAGRAVRIGALPREARMSDIHTALKLMDFNMVSWPLPSWYYGNTAWDYPAEVARGLVDTLVPLRTGSPDFVAYLVRLESEQEAHRLVRRWHLKTRDWEVQRGVEEEDEPPRWTPVRRMTADVVY